MSTKTKPIAKAKKAVTKAAKKKTTPGKRIDADPPPMLGITVEPQVVHELVPALNRRTTTAKEPALGDIDRLVFGIISRSPDWVLIDRNAFESDGQSSRQYIALRRRGFEVAARHVGQVKNYWARWPHALPDLPLVPEYQGDDGVSYGGSKAE